MRGIPDEGVAIAVVVQVLIPADIAGVMFTAEPVTGAEQRGKRGEVDERVTHQQKQVIPFRHRQRASRAIALAATHEVHRWPIPLVGFRDRGLRNPNGRY